VSETATFGLSRRIIAMLELAIGRFPAIAEAKIFGSRAMGNYKNGSDIDLAVFGPGLDVTTIRKLSTLLNEELPIPHHVDVVWYDDCENADLKAHIDAYGEKL
jgi:uncharacterized protein